jgi:glycosyltransferase involved in cell wall biosynthesis
VSQPPSGPGATGAAGDDRLEDLPRALEARLGRVPASVLYLTRNDVEPARALEAAWPTTRVIVKTKADFQGMSQPAVMGALRREAVDLFIVHDRPAMMASLADLYRLSAVGARARRRFLLSADIKRGKLDGRFTLIEVGVPRDLPGLGFRLAREGVAAAWELGRTPLTLGGTSRRRTIGPGPDYRIDYLRSDLSFVGLGAGGSVSHTLGVINGLLEAGHAVDVIAADHVPGLPRHHPVREEVIAPGSTIRVHDEAAMVAYHHRFVGKAERRLREWRPDFLYQRHAVFNATGAVLARRLGIPLVLEANHTEVGAKAMWSRLQFRRLAEQFERTAFESADAIVAVSAIGADALAEVGADRGKILVNPNGVDPNIFSPKVAGHGLRARLGFRPDQVVVGFLGTFTRWHGVLFLAEQVAPLVARHPSARFLFMGDGDLRSAVEDRLRQAGVADRAVFTGLIPHDAVPEHLAACDVLVSPHLPFEDGTPFFGSPTKLFEYLAMGKAVVASNLGQIGDVIDDGKSGMLYGPGMAGEFQATMDRVLSDGGERARLGQNARRRVETEYTWRRNAERAVAFLVQRVRAAYPAGR